MPKSRWSAWFTLISVTISHYQNNCYVSSRNCACTATLAQHPFSTYSSSLLLRDSALLSNLHHSICTSFNLTLCYHRLLFTYRCRETSQDWWCKTGNPWRQGWCQLHPVWGFEEPVQQLHLCSVPANRKGESYRVCCSCVYKLTIWWMSVGIDS